ncbi:hypothetical protein ACGC1H_006116 [Rhizoctonia solani]
MQYHLSEYQTFIHVSTFSHTWKAIHQSHLYVAYAIYCEESLLEKSQNMLIPVDRSQDLSGTWPAVFSFLNFHELGPYSSPNTIQMNQYAPCENHTELEFLYKTIHQCICARGNSGLRLCTAQRFPTLTLLTSTLHAQSSFFATMPSTRQRTPFGKRNWRNGTLLAISEATKLVNIPLAQDVARHIRQVAVALKAPKANNSNAQELAKHVEGLIDALNIAVPYLENSGVFGTGVNGDFLTEIQQLHAHLSAAHTRLQELQAPSYITKLASQAEIREGILLLEKELTRTIVELTLRLLVAVLATGAQNQLVIIQHLDTIEQEYSALLRSQRLTQRRQRTSDKMVRRLEAKCTGLEQRITYLVVLNGVSFFFNS